MIERDREDLVRPTRTVDGSLFAVAIDHIVKVTAFLKPKAFIE